MESDVGRDWIIVVASAEDWSAAVEPRPDDPVFYFSRQDLSTLS